MGGFMNYEPPEGFSKLDVPGGGAMAAVELPT